MVKRCGLRSEHTIQHLKAQEHPDWDVRTVESLQMIRITIFSTSITRQSEGAGPLAALPRGSGDGIEEQLY
jgi:hypothetical protein